MKPATREQLYRLWWVVVLAAHACAGAAWLLMMPGGFPAGHPRFWTNRAAPVAVLVVVAVAFGGRIAGRAPVFASVVLAIACLWLGLAVGLPTTFPVSGWFAAVAALLIGATLALGWFRSLRKSVRARHAIAPALLAAVAGGFLPLTQHAGPPCTRPHNIEFPRGDARARDYDVDDVHAARLGSDVTVQPFSGLVTLHAGGFNMTVQPLLTFVSRSPDGFWSNLSPGETHWLDPPHELSSRWPIKDGVMFNYVDPYTGESSLQVTAPADDSNAVTIEAISRLDKPVYSHLNTFTEIGIAGHQSLALSFSPCPDARIEVLPSDYPVGRPARCAYLAADGTFRVVEASSGEKGPFKTLAQGKLARGEPLTMTLHDAGEAVCRITFEDFSAQAGTDLSPTAGWGLPVNAIEFSRYGDAPHAPVGITITLAGTSVGRGWDTVGHAAGTYRNRMRIERVRR